VSVGAVGDVADPETEHVKMSMDERDRHHTLPQHFKRVVIDALKRQLGHIAGGKSFRLGSKGVCKGGADDPLNFRRAVNWYGPAEQPGKGAHVIEPKEMIHVVVREENGMNQVDLRPQELQAQFRGRVDEQIPLGQADEGGAAIAVIAWVGGMANRTVAAEHRNARRRSRAEKSKRAGTNHHAPCRGYNSKPYPTPEAARCGSSPAAGGSWCGRE